MQVLGSGFVSLQGASFAVLDLATGHVAHLPAHLREWDGWACPQAAGFLCRHSYTLVDAEGSQLASKALPSGAQIGTCSACPSGQVLGMQVWEPGQESACLWLWDWRQDLTARVDPGDVDLGPMRFAGLLTHGKVSWSWHPTEPCTALVYGEDRAIAAVVSCLESRWPDADHFPPVHVCCVGAPLGWGLLSCVQRTELDPLADLQANRLALAALPVRLGQVAWAQAVQGSSQP